MVSIIAKNFLKAFALGLPLFLALLIVASGMSNLSILVFYLLIAFEGMGILYWAISNVRMDEGIASARASPRAYFYPDRNRADEISSFVKSGTKGPSYMRHLSRVEISRVLQKIIEETPATDEAGTEVLIQESKEIDFVLHPKDAKGEPDTSPNLDYYHSLEHVVSRLEAKW